ncbi:hypothetical protein ACFXBB_35700 [Streptomyces scopuliridis]|uniref:hypothetical protein n=1 Tax=Streptomyces scopuliridis TaxID=452529 RepID=UPI0036C69CF9
MGREELTRKRRRAEEARAEVLLIGGLRAIYRNISAHNPLTEDEGEWVLRALAGVPKGQSKPAKAQYRTAAARWHSDMDGGDEELFKLLQEARRAVGLSK